MPNKLKPKTAQSLLKNIELSIGRTFRNFIVGYKDNEGSFLKTKISVLIFDYNGVNFEKNGFQSIEEILPFDPMFLMPNTQMNKLFPESQHPTSVLLSKEIIKGKPFKVEYNNELVETEVFLRISYCKKEERERSRTTATHNIQESSKKTKILLTNMT